MTVTRATIGLGANLGDRTATLLRALELLRACGRVVRVSSFYRSKPWGVTNQPEFLNAVAFLDTPLEPLALLRSLQAIERRLGRVATYRYGPRAIDLDVLTYGKRRLRTDDLELPHPRLTERAFVLVPLGEIAPRYRPLLAALSAAERATVQRIPPSTARSEATVDWDQTLERVRSAAEFCTTSGLSRFRIDEADVEIEIRRTLRATHLPAVAGAALESEDSNGEVASSRNGAGSHEPVLSAKILKAEFVGIVRLSRPAVAEGAELRDDRELAYVESLGIRNPIRAGGPGRVAQIFVTDGQAVEYGQPLFAIEPQVG